MESVRLFYHENALHAVPMNVYIVDQKYALSLEKRRCKEREAPSFNWLLKT